MSKKIIDYPEYEFAGQRPTEEVILILLKHWYTLILPMLVALGIIAVSFIVPSWFGVTSYIFRYAITTFLYYIWLVYWVTRIVHSYAIWVRDQHVLTTERVVNMHQKGLFNRQVTELELDRIQNITHTIKGPVATMLNFGTVTIQSAGADNIVLKNIADPDKIQEEISRLVKDLPRESRIDPRNISDFVDKHKP